MGFAHFDLMMLLAQALMYLIKMPGDSTNDCGKTSHASLNCVALPLKYLAPLIQIHRDNHINPIIFRDKHVYYKFKRTTSQNYKKKS